ncbi:MAG: hypothetical protein EP338_09000 [Bacteroidetes bacterium]|nr:MAG: hypothetical protein EP338_09000 [Bacteroidota bacterium]
MTKKLLLLVGLFAGTIAFGQLAEVQRIDSQGGTTPVNTGAMVQTVIGPGSGNRVDFVKNDIRLAVDRDFSQFVAGPLHVDVTFSVQAIYTPQANGGVNDYNRIYGNPNGAYTLSIDYDPSNPSATQDEAILKFSDCYDVTTTITSIVVNGNPAALPNNMYVENAIFVERYQEYTNAANAVLGLVSTAEDLDQDGHNDILNVSWTEETGAIEYQLEWAFVNSYSGTRDQNGDLIVDELDPSAVGYNFKENSTRVTTTNTHYALPLVFNQGYLVYRVRGVGVDLNNLQRYVFGAWTLLDNDVIANVPAAALHEIENSQAHEENLNWEYAITFAEEGKRKEVLSYFDGTLRNRQSVTKINSDQNVIVGETIYDHRGRPALQVLPVPHHNASYETSLKYYDNFTVNELGVPYKATEFDLDDPNDQCLTPPLNGIGTSSGAGKYYSVQNPNKTNEQGYVPNSANAAGTQAYPFSQVEYTPDNTGRIRRQGGVGKEFQLGSGHETEYLYGQPNQLELDRMFGSEVGYASHYKKNVVVDANGQVSVSYLDQEGRVVATALSGPSPTNLEEIPSAVANAINLEVDALGREGNNNRVSISGESIRLSTELTVAYESNYNFHYGLDVGIKTVDCAPSLCINCVYDLKLELIDECGNNLLSGYQEMVGSFSQGQSGAYYFHQNCTNDYSYDFDPSQAILLGVGKYSLNKILTINEEARNAFLEAYFEDTVNCVKTLDDFYQEELAKVDLTQCEVDCETCHTKLGSLADYLAANKGTAADYHQAKKDCDQACNGDVFDPCSNALNLMLIDMSPGGQYALYDESNGIISADAYPLSILNPGNQLNIFANWREPRFIDEYGNETNKYYNEDGSEALVEVQKNDFNEFEPAIIDEFNVRVINNRFYTVPENLENLTDFVDLFERSWARSLLKYHPEYCYYESCLIYDQKVSVWDPQTSLSFDQLLQRTQTMQDALDAGLVVLKENNGGTGGNGNQGLTQAGPYYDITNWSQQSSLHAWDPFIVYGGSAPYKTNDCSNYGTELWNRVQNYQAVEEDGAVKSMAEVAAYLSRCAQFGYENIHSSCYNFGKGSNTQILDREWQRFKAMYQSVKQELQQARADCRALTECKGYNNCIGNSPFDPTDNGLLDVDGSLASYQSSAYFDEDQPCSSLTASLYADKDSRFPDASIVPDIDPREVAYQLYLQTGQCPVPLAFEGLFNRLISEGKWIAYDVSLKGYVETFNLYNALENYDFSGMVPSLKYSGSVSGDIMDIGISECGDNDPNCFFPTTKFNIQYSKPLGSPDWTEVTSVANFIGTSSLSFRFDALYIDQGTGLQSSFEVTGSITSTSVPNLNLKNCQFEQLCNLNDFGQDLNTLMQTLLGQGLLFSTTPVNLQSAVGAVLTQRIKDQISVGDDLEWFYFDTGTEKGFIIRHQGNTNEQLRISYHNPDDFGNSYIASSSLIPAEQYTFEQTVTKPNQEEVLLRGDVKKIVKSVGSSPVVIGDCEFPMSLKCDAPEYENYDDFEKVILELFSSQTVDLEQSVNLFASSQMTVGLEAALGVSSTSSTLDIRGNSKKVIITTGSCPIELSFDAAVAPGVVLSFNDLNYPDNFTFLGDTGGVYAFQFTTQYEVQVSGGGAYFGSKLIQGTTCVPIKPCYDCREDASIYTGLPSSRIVDPESQLQIPDADYLQFKANVAKLNASVGRKGKAFSDDRKIFERLKGKGQLATFETYVSTKSGQSTEPVDMVMRTVPGGTPCDDDPEYQEYSACIQRLIDWANNLDPLTISEFDDLEGFKTSLVNMQSCSFFEAGDYSFCINEMCARINEVIDGYYEFSFLFFVEFYVNPQAFCEPISLPPCEPFTEGIPVESPSVDTRTDCKEMLTNQAYFNAVNQYREYQDNLLTELRNTYNKHCLTAEEELTYSYDDKQYHYTLYYYDQAGNLIKTVPPEGVELLPLTSSSSTDPNALVNKIASDREKGTKTVFTDHRMVTRYEYNSLNQLIAQSVPDADPIDEFDLSKAVGLDVGLIATRVQMVDGQTGYLAGHIGTKGYLYKTTDGGATWNRINNLVSADLRAIEMYDANIGFALGEAGTVLATINGGQEWQMLPTWTANSGSYTADLNDLIVKNVSGSTAEVWLVGDQKTVLKLLFDTGSLSATWIDLSAGVSGLAENVNVESIISASSKDYISVTELLEGETVGRIYEKAGSSSWVEVSYDIGEVYALSSTGNVVYLAAWDGRLFKRDLTDATPRWLFIPTNLVNPIKKMSFFNENQGYALVENQLARQLYQTLDGGKTWEKASDSYYNDLVMSSNAQVMLAVGDAGLIDLLVQDETGERGPTKMNFSGPENPSLSPDDENLTAAWIYSTDASSSSMAAAVGSETGRFYFTKNLEAESPTWKEQVINETAAEIEGMLHSSGKYVGVIRTNSGALISFDYLATGGLNTGTVSGIGAKVFSSLANRFDGSAIIYAFNDTGNKLGKLTIASNANITYAEVSGTVSVLATANDMVLSGNKVFALENTGNMTELTLSLSDFTERDVTHELLPGTLSSLAVHNDQLYAVGENGQLYVQGTQHMELQQTSTDRDLFDLAVQGSSGDVILVGEEAFVSKGALTNRDFGLTEGVLSSNDRDQFAGQNLNAVVIHPSDDTKIYIAGDGGKIVYRQGTDNSIFSLGAQAVQDFDFAGTVLYAVTDETGIYQIMGTSSLPQKQVFGPPVIDVHFADPYRGIVLSEGFTVRTTEDGASNWNIVKAEQTSMLSTELNRVFRYNEDLSILFGDGGSIFQVQEGLASPSGVSGYNDITEVAGHPATGEIYFGAQTSGLTTIAKIGITNTGGNYTLSSTTLQTMSSVSNIKGLQVFPSGAYAAVTSNKDFRYFNASGTQTWIQDLGSVVVNDLYFHDERNGVLVGNNGLYLKLTDANINMNGDLIGGSFNQVGEIASADPDLVDDLNDVNLNSISFASFENAVIAGNYRQSLGGTATVPYVRAAYDPSDRYTSKFYYDRLGRLIVSQNGRQADAVGNGLERYSYTLYDHLGRVIEVGEKIENSAANTTLRFKDIFGTEIADYYNPNMIDDQRYRTWISESGGKYEVTRTYYSNDGSLSLPADYEVSINTARNRITSVTYAEGPVTVDYDNYDHYDHATHYVYDIHGNVKTLFQENRLMDNISASLTAHRIKRVDYRYDLISGNVHRVSVQSNQPDQWHHAYDYDADNRITESHSTSETPKVGIDGPVARLVNELEMNSDWDNDARYFYYDHGPLSRVEIGQENLQGCDYVYNLQGWLKGVNSSFLDGQRDPGLDGFSPEYIVNENKNFAPDVMSFSLSYFDGDYEQIKASDVIEGISRVMQSDISNSDITANSSALFNGNIRAMQTTIMNPTTREMLPMATAYKYDQLQRLREARSFVNFDQTNNKWNLTGSYDNRYFNSFAYDANGNINGQYRFNAAGQAIDSLSYKYHDVGGKRQRNRLYHVDDQVSSGAFGDDIDDMGTVDRGDQYNVSNNYKYDKEGRLIRDNQENIQLIRWRVDGKIKEIIRNVGGTEKILRFQYDAMGNRIAKHVYSNTDMLEKSTYYILDAQGNTMNVYEYDVNGGSATFQLAERHLYGSDRLGINKRSVNLLSVPTPNGIATLTAGDKFYEMKNHLGNVLTVVQDKQDLVESGGNVTGYLTHIASSTDYSPFGVVLDGRNFTTNSNYRYGFQNQERDDEIKGEGNSWNYKYRMHDPRLGRFFAIDPLTSQYPSISPYQFSNNRPIDRIELEGLEDIKFENARGVNFIGGKGMTQEAKDAYTVRTDMAGKVAGVLLGGAGFAAAISSVGVATVGTYLVEEAGEYVFEEVTGIPVINDPLDVLEQLLKKGAKKFSHDVIIEGRKYLAGESVKKMKDYAYNVKKFGKEAAEKYRRGEITKEEAKDLAAGVCFVAGTKVKTKHGYTNIENIKLDSKVWSFDLLTNREELKSVKNIFITDSVVSIVRLVIQNETIETTANHPFYVEGRWIEAKDLVVGDKLYSLDSEGVILSRKYEIDTLVTVYNFEVSENHNYFVSGLDVLVHNDCINRKVLTNKQASVIAKKLGFGEKLPDGRIPSAIKKQTGSNPVYYDKRTKRYFSPDKAGHRADNAWKKFDKEGNRETGVFENGNFQKVSQ